MQLMSVQIIPATYRHPATGYTLLSLELFHSQNLKSRVNSNQFCEGIANMTAFETGDMPLVGFIDYSKLFLFCLTISHRIATSIFCTQYDYGDTAFFSSITRSKVTEQQCLVFVL